uniref:organic solute transporter subunit beta-like n=1 Tax=Myxine glutinosa TaxID=7769 RepID=UPI00358F5A08
MYSDSSRADEGQSSRASPGPQNSERTPLVENGISHEDVEKLKWYYRTGDDLVWKYTILALAVLACIIGVLLFSNGILAQRKEKQSPPTPNSQAERMIMVDRSKDLPDRQLPPAPVLEDAEIPVSYEHSDTQRSPDVGARSPSTNVSRSPRASGGTSSTPHAPPRVPADQGSPRLRPGEVRVSWKDGTVSSLYGTNV